MGELISRWAMALRLRASTLRFRLIAISLLTIGPALVIVLFSVAEQRQQGAEAAQDQALQWASLVAEQHNQHLESTRQTLALLARLPEVQDPSSADCPALLEETLAATPLFAGMIVAEPDGTVICSGLPLSEPVHFGDRLWFQETMETGRPVVGAFQRGRVSDRPVIPVAQPVFQAGELVSVVSASLDLAWLNSALDTSLFPSGTRVTVFDENGSILLRYPEPGEWVGRRAPETSVVHQFLSGPQAATARGQGLEGDERLFAYLRMEGGESYVSMSVPAAVAFADANRTLWRNLGFLALGAMVALAAAWGGGHALIVRPVGDLLQATRRITGGEYRVRLGPPYDGSELGSLAQHFDFMAQVLAERQKERDQFLASVEAARERTEQAYRLLAEVTSVLATSTDYRATIERAARAAVPVFADGCLVHILDESSQPQLAALTHSNENSANVLRRVVAEHPPNSKCPLSGLFGFSETPEPRLVSNLPQAARQAGIADSPMVRTLEDIGVASAMSLPLLARGKLVGMMTLLTSAERRYGRDELEVAEKLAAASAMAVDTARLYEEEQKARQAEVRARAEVTSILESITDSFFALDREWRFTYVNQEAERLLRRNRGDLLGRNVWEEFPEAVHSGVYEAYQKAITEQISIGLEEYYPPLEMWIEVHAYPMEGGLAVYFRDITDRKQAEESLRNADRQKSEFLAILAHELRNPLAVIHSAVSMNQGVTDPESRWAWDAVGRQAEHMKRLLDDLLDIARVTRGKITLRQQPLDATRTMERATEMVRPLIEERQHHLTMDRPESPIWVYGDEDRLTQVLGNLLTNAARYTPKGGDITFRIETTEDEVLFAVKDNGIGISREALPLLFNTFARGPNTESDGLGLGLALVKSLVELHQGTVEARSNGPGTGSLFIVRLPRLLQAEQEVPSNSPPAETSEPQGHPPRVLLVDDNGDLARLMSRMLEKAGYEVRTVADGPNALELSRSFRPEVILLDIGLPGMSGLEVARRMRQQEETCSTRIITLSGYGGPQDIQQSKEAGCDAHLVKPTPRADLLAALRPTKPAA